MSDRLLWKACAASGVSVVMGESVIHYLVAIPGTCVLMCILDVVLPIKVFDIHR